ncbi:MAG: hypothetical protein JNM84_08615 [Planctomycetes bacterium]|nr:hypothetical protein [Planctomycetota bacterium]
MLTVGLALAVACAFAFQDPVPAIYPVVDDSGPIEVRTTAGREEQWMCTRLVDGATRAALRGRISAYIEHEHPEPATWAPLRVAESDAEGWVRLRIDDLLAERGLWLVAEAEGYAPSAEMTAFPPLPWELERSVDIPLQVLDALGRPVPGARIGWHLGCGHTADSRQVHTDAEGRATMPGAHGDYGELWITGPRILGEYNDFGAWRAGRGVHLLHCDPAPTWKGVVLGSDGRPRAGVHVGLAEYHRGPWCLTDAEGRFVLEGADTTSVAVADERTGEEHWFDLPPRGSEARFVLPPRGEDLPEIERPEAENVRIRIDVPAGSPSSEVELEAWCPETRFVDRQEIEIGDELSIAWPPGRYELVFGGGKGDWREQRAVLTVPREGSAELKVALAPRKRVRMWLDPTTAFAQILPEHGDVQLVTPTWRRSIEEDLQHGNSIAVPENEEWAVRLRLFDRAHHIPSSLVDANGELELSPLQPHRIRLRFADASGRSLRGRARLAKHPRGQQEYEGEAEWSPDGERVELVSWLGPGRWLLIVEAAEESWRAPRAISELELPTSTSEVLDVGTVVLVPALERGLSLRLPDGSPAAGVRVTLRDERIELDEEGRQPPLEFAGPGDVVSVDLEDGVTVPLTQTLEGAGPWELRWPAGELQLEVRDARGEPIPRFAVHLDGTTYEDVEGKLALRGLATGPRELIVAAQGCAPQRLTLDLAPRASATVRLDSR